MLKWTGLIRVEASSAQLAVMNLFPPPLHYVMNWSAALSWFNSAATQVTPTIVMIVLVMLSRNNFTFYFLLFLILNISLNIWLTAD